MRVTYSDGRRAVEYETYAEAVSAVEAEWSDAVVGHDGDLADGGDRTLCWATEAAAQDDPGLNACASIREVA